MMRFLSILLALALSGPASAQYIGGLGTAEDSRQHPGYIPYKNYWYTMNLPGLTAENLTTPSLTNVVFCTPSYIPIHVWIKTLGWSIHTGGAGGFSGAAIYNNSPSHRPGTLLDYAAPASTAVTTQVHGTLHNTLDLLTPGIYWVCYSIDNNTAALASSRSNSLTGGWSIGSATLANMQRTTANITGLKCTVSTTTCGGTGSGWAPWSAGTFTWGDATSVTWTDATDTGPIITMEVN